MPRRPNRRDAIGALGLALAIAAFSGAVGCRIALPSPPVDRWPTQFTDADIGYLRVFYATDRNDTSAVGDSTPPVHERFGILPQRGLTYGVATVSIPPGHVKGRIESPPLLAGPNPARHMTITDLKVLARASDPNSVQTFFESMRARLRGPHASTATAPAGVAGGNERDVLVFVHGFATTFDEAVVNAAQVAHDIGFDGLVVCYSWTSAGAILSYLADGQNVEWTVRYFAEFLAQLSDHNVAERVHLLAHSMGSRVVTRGVLAYMALRDGGVVRELLNDRLGEASAPARREFGQVIFAAADVDAAIFERDFVPLLQRAADRTTVYISTRDFALLVSGQLHDFSRLGRSDLPDVDLPMHERLDVIDASQVDHDPVGHFYFSESPEVLDDISAVLDCSSTKERGLRRQFLYTLPQRHRPAPRATRVLDSFEWLAP